MEITIQKMYHMFDENCWDIFPEIFDKGIVYYRPGHPTLNGINEVIYFFKHDRAIAAGQHCLGNIGKFNNNLFVALGSYKGTLKTGEDINVDFCDVLGFNGAKINYRKTFLSAIPI